MAAMTRGSWQSCIFIAVLLMARKFLESMAYGHDGQTTIIPSQTSIVPAYWEEILREFVFKTISSPLPGNNGLYKRILQAPFYGGPLPAFPHHANSVVLSRGDVFYNPITGAWLLCQEACSNCQVCLEQSNPMVKWVLRRIKRQSAVGPSRYDLQLTIVPQDDNSFHMKNIGSRSYIYVTSPTDQVKDTGLSNWRNVPSYDVDSNVDENYNKAGSPWRLVERNIKDREIESNLNVTQASPETTTTSSKDLDVRIVTQANNSGEQKNRSKNYRRRSRQRMTTLVPSSTPQAFINYTVDPLTVNKISEIPQILSPKLIMGTDQHGQRHLIHVVLAEDLSNGEITLTQPLTTSLTKHNHFSKLNSTTRNDEAQSSYEKLYQRIVDSLNANKKSIEKFLQIPRTKVLENDEGFVNDAPDTSESKQDDILRLISDQNKTNNENGTRQTQYNNTIAAPVSLIASKRLDNSQENEQWDNFESLVKKKDQKENSSLGVEETTSPYNEIGTKPIIAQRRRPKTRAQRVAASSPEENNSRNRKRRTRIQPTTVKPMHVKQSYSGSHQGVYE